MEKDTFKLYAGGLKSAETQLKEGYEYNAVIYRCISEIARCAADLEVEDIDVKGEYVEKVSISKKLLAQPNNYQTQQEFIEAALTYHLATGSAYIEAITNLSGSQVIELHVIPSSEMTIQTQPSTSPYHAFKYTWSNATGSKQWLVNSTTGLIESYNSRGNLSSRLLHFKKFNPRSPKEGLSPLSPGGSASDMSNGGLKWNNSLLENLGRPPGIFKTADKLDDSIWTRLETFVKKFSGKSNAGKVPVLEGGLEWQSTGLSPTDMDFVTALNQADKYIGSVFGVPIDLILGSATFNNADVAREQLYLNTIIPLMNSFLSKLSAFIEPKATTSLRINEEDVPALEPMRTRKYTRLLQARKANILTVNEIRLELGFEQSPDPEADELFGMQLGAIDSVPNVDEVQALRANDAR